jgi:hypothetical protein
MRVESPGIYSARGYSTAEVFGIRGQFCFGYVVHPGDTKKAAVWRVKDGNRVNGPSDEDLVKYLWSALPPKKAQKRTATITPENNEKAPWTC